MRKIMYSLVMVGAVVLFSGCGGQPTPAEIKKEQIQIVNDLPSWILNPSLEGGISAVGITGYSRHGMEIMLPQAEMDGRAKLAGQIQTIVSQVQKSAMRHVKVNDTDDFEKAFKKATKEVIKKVPLSGAKRVKVYQAADGTMYVMMTIQKRAISQHLSDMKNTYKKNMEEAKLTRASIDEGMKVLDGMMDELNDEM